MSGQPPEISLAEDDERTQAYLGQRPRLLRLAYRYLGSVAEAEDIVQDAWLRYAKAERVKKPEHFLSRVVTNLCLDRLKSAERQRIDYVGPWLPEPALSLDVADDCDSELDISYAVMRTLERLSAPERAALFLHDLFGLSFDEIAETLQRSPASCRQLAARARKAVRSGRKRNQPTRADIDRLIGVLMQSVASGDHTAFAALLSEDAEVISDGGGKTLAARNIVTGRDNVARLLTGLARKLDDPAALELQVRTINDQPGLVVYLDGHVEQTFVFDLDDDGLVAGIYVVRNPDKLKRLEEGRTSL